MIKIITWLGMNAASILAGIQLVIRTIKELLTAIINVLSIILPTIAAEKVILKIRAGLNVVDDFITKIKDMIVPKVV